MRNVCTRHVQCDDRGLILCAVQLWLLRPERSHWLCNLPRRDVFAAWCRDLFTVRRGDVSNCRRIGRLCQLRQRTTLDSRLNSVHKNPVFGGDLPCRNYRMRRLRSGLLFNCTWCFELFNVRRWILREEQRIIQLRDLSCGKPKKSPAKATSAASHPAL